MSEYRRNSHSISNLSCHIVWATKHRYQVLQGDLQHRCPIGWVSWGFIGADAGCIAYEASQLK